MEGKGLGMTIKGDLCDNGTVLHLNFGWWLHESIHMIKWHRTTHTHTFQQCQFPLLTLFHSYVRYNHWGKMSEKYTGLLCTTFSISFEFIIFSK